ncbi:MAG: HlyD family efflux transporter periplasmic adaptor subunit [Prochlorotrichaceae cyanobacterium]
MTQSSGSNGNGNGSSGGALVTQTPGQAENRMAVYQPAPLAFEQPVILRQSPWASRFVVWAIVGISSFTIAWACIAKVEEAIPAQGKLEPKAAVKEVQAPVAGVVSELKVEEGETVQVGQELIRFDQTTSQAQDDSLRQILASLEAETAFYRSQMNNAGTVSRAYTVPSGVPDELFYLTENRAALVAENEYFRAQLGSSSVGLDAAQLQRLRAAQAEKNSRVAAAELEVQQLERQLSQVQVQLESNRNNLATNQAILDDITPLMEEGGLARVQFLRQQQEVQTLESEIDRLLEEEQRLLLDIQQAKEQLQNTIAVSNDDLYQRIADNDKRISEINSQLNKLIVENQKQIDEIRSQLSQTEQTLQYQVLTAPVSGKIFDLQPTGPGFVANTSEPILKIVPDDGKLVARVFITNRDIGFVSVGQDVDVRIDSFPYSEFGDVKGELIRISPDALEPDEIYQYFRYPAEIALDQQQIVINGNPTQLQSGMSVSVNIKTRPRRIITFLTDLFVRKVDSLRTSR